MEEIGRLLRESREKLGLTLDEVERATRIRRHHLEALERGGTEELPSPVQARGFLSNYADFLGLDADEVLLRYAEKLRAGKRSPAARGSAQRQEAGAGSVQVRPRRFPWLTSDLFVALFIVAAVLAVVIWGGGQVMTALQAEREAGPQAEASLLATPAESATPPAATAAPDGPAQAPAATAAGDPQSTLPPDLLGEGFGGTGVSVRILVEQRAWLEVSVDGETDFEGRVAPGEILEFRGEEAVQVLTGNGRALRIVYNGEDQGVLGDVGEVVTRLWTPQGQLTPTPSATPTATATADATETPTPTATSSPPATAVP